MPPKRTGSKSASSSASDSDSDSSSSSSSSGSSSSSSSGSDDSSSDSSNSQKSKKNNSSTDSSNSSANNSSADEGNKANKNSSSSKDKKASKTKKVPSRRPSTNALPTTRTTRSSASSASESESPKKSNKKADSKNAPKSSKEETKATKVQGPKKSATAKPKAGDNKTTKRTLSGDDSDSEGFNDFSLGKMAAKVQAKSKQAAMAASSSPGSQASPSVKPSATPTSSSITKSTSSTSGGTAKSSSTAKPSSNPSTVEKSGRLGERYKGIFSESSESEAEVPAATTSSSSKKKPSNSASASKASKKRVPSPSPPKLSPQKKGGSGAARMAAAAAAKKAAAKKKPAAPASNKKKASKAAARDNSTESESAKSESESDEEVTIKKPTPTTTAAKNQKSASNTKKTPPAKSGSASQNNKKKSEPKPAPPPPSLMSSDSESGIMITPTRATRRQTRGGNGPKKSKHILSSTKQKVQKYEETESETEDMGEKSTPSSPRKRMNSSSHVKTESKPAANGFAPVVFEPVRRDIDGLAPMEQRKCPIQDCDSSGHLNGKLDRHFTPEACPVYHNTTKKTCQTLKNQVNKKNRDRDKATTSMATKSPLGSPSAEQRHYSDKVKQQRSKFKPDEVPETDEILEDRELGLDGFASEWDLQLFREAQAGAAEDHENALKGLPDSKTPKSIELGKFEMEVWYQSPYPEEYSCLPKLYICEFCLKYLKSATQLRRHAAKCVWNHPPGDEIYRKEPISVFEICGKRYKQYCQSLCLLAKFFLDHKTLYFDVEPFLFYVMTTADSSGCHIVGYFSKEKNSVYNYNVSCILTLPPYQRQGFGRLLIDFSYLLSRAENKIGSPEKPLSDLGLMTYRAYWKDVLLEYICNYPEREISIKAFCDEMGINPYDIVSTLQSLGMIKYWKGQHIILRKEDMIGTYLEKTKNRKGRQIDNSKLKWKPYEPTARERKQAMNIKKNQEEKQKKR